MSTPLIDYMNSYFNSQMIRFDTPGHKAGAGLADAMKILFATGAVFDMTLPDEAAQWANGCVAESEKRAAGLWGARRTLYCYNGTTAAIQALLLATLRPGDKIIVASNCHRSVINGLVLCGAEPVFIAPRYSDKLQMDLNVPVENVAAALSRCPEAKAVFLTNPTYFGAGCDLSAICELVHGHGALLLVDEAHGAHWRFTGNRLKDALSCGADAVAQSTHKMLPALSQASMLHIGSERIDTESVRQALKMIQSSSPNYLLLASLDAVQADFAVCGTDKLAAVYELVKTMRGEIAATPLICYNSGMIVENGGYCFDECKVILDFAGTGIRGAGIEREFLSRGVVPEMCDTRHALFHLTTGDCPDSVKRLANAAKRIYNDVPAGTATENIKIAPPCPVVKMSPREAFYAGKKRCLLEQAPGQTSAGTVCFYPPGIPVLFPGCIISSEAVEYIRAMEREGIMAEGFSAPLYDLEILA